MINTANGSVISPQPLTRVRQDLFALQDDLAKEVSQSLRGRLGQVVRELQVRAGTNSVAAWERVLQSDALTKGVDSLLPAADSTAAGTALARTHALLTPSATMARK